jgi:hypothetical protein
VNETDNRITSLVPLLGNQPLEEGRDLGDVIGRTLNTSLRGPSKESRDGFWGNLSYVPDSDAIKKLEERAERDTWCTNIPVMAQSKTVEVFIGES